MIENAQPFFPAAMPREDANKYLHIVRLALSYRLMRPTPLRGIVSRDDVVRVLNGCAVNGAYATAEEMPVLLTIDETAAMCGVSREKILKVMRPRKGGMPCFLLSSKNRLTSEKFVRQWLAAQ